MANTRTNLAIGQITNTTLTTIYSPPTSKINTKSSSILLTNTSTNAVDIDIYQNNGTIDLLQATVHLPGISGGPRAFHEIKTINGDHSIKLQGSVTATWNYNMDGIETEITS
tara:strand:+ start:1745 stop:2080 length:336 start_codon:yes stop_codon:yes gene_type:complete